MLLNGVNKKDLVLKLKKKTDIQTIIMDENYQLTKTDLCLIAYSMNIPIVVIIQSSNLPLP